MNIFDGPAMSRLTACCDLPQKEQT